MAMMLPLLKRSLYLTSPLSITPKNATFILRLSSSASATQNPSPKSNIMADYLIKSFGFPPQKAATASNYIAHSASTENADSVRNFLERHGFTESQIHAIVSWDARILVANVDETLRPNYKALRDIGYFSDAELNRLLTYHPRIFTHPRAIPRLNFWKEFLMNDKKKLLTAFVRNPGLICQDIDSGITPKISLLKDYGLSQNDIAILLLRGPGVFRRSVTSMEALLNMIAKELQLADKSWKFARCLIALSSIGTDNFQVKKELFMSFGWTERDFLDALRRDPLMVRFSEENIRGKVEFLVGKGGCENSYIVSHPSILGFSLEKRLMPRCHVMNILKSSNLVGRVGNLYNVICLTEKKFLDKVIFPNMARLPELHDTYIAACASQIPL
ncbi:uncharacterized protein A4U43_C03F1340 [Asparagus officinalis]|uniref:Uncharacterized protein n=1 Tax=Asparagus officinalis TaxID=4686 RepID=A0A5P1F6H0_ASPOF|nr:uncharacterized protein LOC109832642 [Asparagus officinalis]XP_020255614.1 uncharacterized protein LOC109832642 [Asparagus officinalis]XP_020255615.1 uncharacterized protein LOC109832642 [Asparagus officinalis]XP_020255616.1 uncharacterized protein LOC109832642 [Asparagus officinalis]ONK73958.1 uncharacterized protein A4U43_C03F1340 [Asparagus officinalis]